MQTAELGAHFNLKSEQVRRRIGSALVKLPQGELETLRAYLDQEDHRFHQDLTYLQRSALKRTIELGLQLHQLRRAQSAKAAQPGSGVGNSSNIQVDESHTATGLLTELHLPITAEARSDAVFELFILTREWLHQSPLTYAETWGRSISKVPAHIVPHSLFELWYAFGLLPRVDFQSARNTLVQVTMSRELKLNEVRANALRTIMQRVSMMPEMLALVALSRKQTTALLHARISNATKISVPQLNARLRALESLGALQGDNGWVVTKAGLEVLQEFPAKEDGITPSEPMYFDERQQPAMNDEIGFLEI